MVQFYFLAVFVNLIGGLYFANSVFEKSFPAVKKVVELFNNSLPKLVFGILAGATGVFLIISAFGGDVPVVGDLLIALSSIVICLYFLRDIIVKKTDASEPIVEEIVTEEVSEADAKEEAEADAVEGDGLDGDSIIEAKPAEKKKVDFQECYSKFYTFAEKFKVPFGIAAIVLAVLHFCFPGVILI